MVEEAPEFGDVSLSFQFFPNFLDMSLLGISDVGLSFFFHELPPEFGSPRSGWSPGILNQVIVVTNDVPASFLGLPPEFSSQ